MAKNSLINIGKSIFSDLKDKLIDQGKEALLNSKDELIEKGKEVLLKTANDKVNELSKGKVNLNQFFNSDTSRETTGQRAESNTHTEQENKTSSNSNSEKTKVREADVEVVLPNNAGEKYRDAAGFERQLDKGLQTLAQSAARNPVEAAMVLKELITMAGEVSKFTEVQKTKRKEIESDRDKYVSKINAQKEVMLAYLDKTFDERKDNFEKLFRVVDHALANNNTQELALSLNGINQLAASSPFKDLASIESTQQALNDKDHIWDI